MDTEFQVCKKLLKMSGGLLHSDVNMPDTTELYT